MANVTLSPYEIEHGRLPPVCVKCGQQTNDILERTVRQVGGRWAIVQGLGLMIGVVFFPPLLLWVIRRIPAVHLRLPFCADDQVRNRRQERRALHDDEHIPEP